MHTFAAAGAGFLLAVLWFDFSLLPPRTTEACPMNRLVALVMLLTLAAI